MNLIQKLPLLGGLLLFIVFSSCNKEITSDSNEALPETVLKVDNGHLAFKDYSEFSSYLQKSILQNSSDRKKLEAQINFQSLSSLYEELKSKAAEFEAKESSFILDTEYEPLFIYNESGLKYKRDNDLFATVINKDGLFSIGDVLYKSIDEGRVIASVKNFELLKNINSVNDYLLNGTDEIKIDWFTSHSQFVDYKSKAHARISAGPYNEGSNKFYLISVRNESNNRRFYVEMISELGYVPLFGVGGTPAGFNLSSFLTLGFSHTKKGAFGIWSNYTSPTYVQELKIKSVYPYQNWVLRFSGTLNNNSNAQSYNDQSTFPYFGPPITTTHYNASEAASWVEADHIFSKPTSITATGNGQIFYTNTYN